MSFRKLLEGEAFSAIEAYNGLIGRSIAQNGFKCCYVSYSCLSLSKGEEDNGVVTLESMLKTIKEVHLSSGLPVIADSGECFTLPHLIAKTIYDYQQAGATCLIINDVNSKDKAQLIFNSLENGLTALKKYSNFSLCVRIDRLGYNSKEEFLSKIQKYFELGIEIIFPSGFKTIEAEEEIVSDLKNLKKNCLILADGVEMESKNKKKLKEIGVNCILYPDITLNVAINAIDQFLDELIETGSQKNFINKMQSRKELYELLQYTPGKEWYYPTPTSDMSHK